MLKSLIISSKLTTIYNTLFSPDKFQGRSFIKVGQKFYFMIKWSIPLFLYFEDSLLEGRKGTMSTTIYNTLIPPICIYWKNWTIAEKVIYSSYFRLWILIIKMEGKNLQHSLSPNRFQGRRPQNEQNVNLWSNDLYLLFYTLQSNYW